MVSHRETTNGVYFWGGPFSNFYCGRSGLVAPFINAPLWWGGPDVKFKHSEGYYMAQKALFFGDAFGRSAMTEEGPIYTPPALTLIQAAAEPKLAKSHGRDVENFVEERWSAISADAMFRAVWFKFSQNPDLARKLIDTEDKLIVEGSPLDKIWGVGLAWDDPLIEDSANWLGKNGLGKILMVVRGLLADMDLDEIENFNPFRVVTGIEL